MLKNINYKTEAPRLVDDTCRSPRNAAVVTAVVVLFLMTPIASAQAPLVTITGGAREGNSQFYDWKVTNNHSSPIISIQFPHYHGDTFESPEGWSQEWENRAMLGGKNAPGLCRTSAETLTSGIRKNRSLEFTMRVNRAGALPRPNQVTVRFADGSEFIVENVETPTANSWIERNIMPLALGVIFIIALLWHAKARKKPDDQPIPEPEPDDGAPQ